MGNTVQPSRATSLTGDSSTRQDNPEIKLAERKAGIVDNAKYLQLLSPDLKPEDMNTRKMKKLDKEFNNYIDQLEEQTDLTGTKKSD